MKDAVQKIKEASFTGSDGLDYVETLVALDVLKSVSEQEPCEDAISRQAVLDMMQMRMGGKELYKAIYNLPSVQPKPCTDAVSRQAVIRITEQGQVQGYEWQFKQLCVLPSVTPAPKTGRWIEIDDNESECSECGHREFNERFLFEDINFCAKCGVKMQEVGE